MIVPSALRFSLSSAQFVDLAEKIAAWLTWDDPFSPSFAKNSVKANVLPFFFLAFLATTENNLYLNTGTINDECYWENDWKWNQIEDKIKEKEKSIVE